MKKALIIPTIVMVTVTITMAFLTTVWAITDIQGHWGEENIKQLIDSDYINGYPDGTFRPDNNMSNAEFTKILIEALGYDLGVSNEGHWSLNYIEKAKGLEVLKAGEFKSYDDPITRGQIANMIIRAVDEETPVNLEEYKAQIKDFSQIPKQYQENILKAYAKGIIRGNPDGTFRYINPATRAEASTMLVRMLDADKRVTPILQPIQDSKDSIVIDGSKVAVENEVVIPYYHLVKEVLENTGGELVISDVDSSGFISMALWLDGDTGPHGISIRVSFQYKFDNGIGEEITEPYRVILDKRNDNTKAIAKELLKIFYPIDYEKAYNDLTGTIYQGTRVERVYDNRTLWIIDFPASSSIRIGG